MVAITGILTLQGEQAGSVKEKVPAGDGGVQLKRPLGRATRSQAGPCRESTGDPREAERCEAVKAEARWELS